jgi:predicted XRE-type DNA-binding protein
MTTPIDHETSSGNVFADIGLPDAADHLIKAELVFKIDALLKARKIRQIDAATLFGIRQPDVSKMLNGDFRQFSVERLMRFLVALGQSVDIVVRPPSAADTKPALRVA